MAPFSSLAVANFFIEKAKSRRGRRVDPMKLQKLLYFAHGWHLAVTGKPLLDEPVEAWQYGPVVSSIYHEFKAHGRDPISEPAMCLDPETFDYYAPRIPEEALETRAVLERVWKVYGEFSGPQLSTMTHSSDGPWAKTRARTLASGIQRGGDIPNDEIREYFVDVASRNR